MMYNLDTGEQMPAHIATYLREGGEITRYEKHGIVKLIKAVNFFHCRVVKENDDD